MPNPPPQFFRTPLAALLIALVAPGCPSAPTVEPGLGGNVLVGDASAQDAPGPRPNPDATISDATDLGTDATQTDATQTDATQTDALADAEDAAVPNGDSGAADASETNPCLAPAVITLTSSQAAARAFEFDQQVVTITATAGAAPVSCTEAACPPSDPCCNQCTAQVALGNNIALVGHACFASPGCSGDTCSPLVCSPPVLPFPQSFRGVLSASPLQLQLLAID